MNSDPSHRIATIIPYCSNEERFLRHCIEGARPFSDQILIISCDHTFDGVLEDKKRLEEAASSFSDCNFYLYPLVKDRIPKREYKKMGFFGFWHTLSRWIGVCHLMEEIDYVLFLDTDEVVDSKSFYSWLDTEEYRRHQVMKLANYWYFREPSYQGKKWEDSVVFARKEILTRKRVLQKGERNAIYDLGPPLKSRYVVGLDRKPMVHHYSWVRTKEEMLKKVTSWGHKEDRNWPQLVEEEFSRPFNGTDFVHGYEYETVKPLIDLAAPFPKQQAGSRINVLSERELVKTLHRM